MRPDGSLRAALVRPRAKTERAVEALLAVSAGVSILTTVVIVLVLVRESVGFFRAVPLVALLDAEWSPLFDEPRFGLAPLFAGTLVTTALALAVSVPLGLLAALYLSELATPRARRWLRGALFVLAGIPSVVYGAFALAVVTPLVARVVPGLGTFNALSASLALAVMAFPTIVALSLDALTAVPRSLREAGYALGASRLSIVLRVVLPTARSGLYAAVLLAASRSVGETMIVTIAAGQQPRLTLDPRGPMETLTSYVAQVSLGDAPSGTLEHHTVFAVGLALFVTTLAMNLLARRMRRRMLAAGADA
jgi:phosphate transport system permease protein